MGFFGYDDPRLSLVCGGNLGARRQQVVDVLDRFHAEDVRGRFWEWHYGSAAGLLLMVTPRCHGSALARRRWTAVIAGARRRSFRTETIATIAKRDAHVNNVTIIVVLILHRLALDAAGTPDDDMLERSFRTDVEAMAWADDPFIVPLRLDEWEELLGDNGNIIGSIVDRHDI